MHRSPSHMRLGFSGGRSLRWGLRNRRFKSWTRALPQAKTSRFTAAILHGGARRFPSALSIKRNLEVWEARLARPVFYLSNALSFTIWHKQESFAGCTARLCRWIRPVSHLGAIAARTLHTGLSDKSHSSPLFRWRLAPHQAALAVSALCRP